MKLKSFHLPIRPTQAVGLLAALSIAAMVVTVAWLLWNLRERELEHARLETVSLTEMFMEQTKQYFDGTDMVLQGVQERLGTDLGSQIPWDGELTHLLLSSRVAAMRQLRALALVDATGMVINSSRDFPNPRISVAERNYFKYFAQGGSDAYIIDRPVRGMTTSQWTLHMARPLRDTKSGKFRGVIVASIDISKFEELYYILKLDFVRPIAIYLEDGTLLASLPHRENMIGDFAPELSKESLPAIGNGVRTVLHISGDGGRQLFGLGHLTGYPVLLSISNEEELSLASWRETAFPIAVGTVCLIIFTVFSAFVLIRNLNHKSVLGRELHAANDLYQHTVESVMDAIVAVDESMRIQLFNPAAETMFGLSAGEAMGRSLHTLLPERLRSAHAGHVGRFSDSESESRAMASHIEIVGLRSDGSEFPIESTISQTKIAGRLQMTAVLRDVTARHRAEGELRETNRQLRGLSASLQNVREQERTRIARELHDELGQQLTGIKLSLSWLGGRIKDGRVTTTDNIDEMRGMLDTAITTVRRISTELRPLILDELGFQEAVTWHANEFAKRSGLDITVNLAAAGLITGDEWPTAFFRIVQESLTNVARHAGATTVQIDLKVAADNLVLSVHDNGIGMKTAVKKDGIGLVSMRERANAIGAQFNISSSVGAGTTVEVTIALNTQTEPGNSI